MRRFLNRPIGVLTPSDHVREITTIRTDTLCG